MKVSPLILLGVNIDHVATIRQARLTVFPEPVQTALLAEQAGADSITAHLREDRRHIQDRDIERLREMIHSRLNLEMAVSDEMLAIAEQVRPQSCCLVPEKRQELTTEGGLDVIGSLDKVHAACERLASAGIETSLFIDADCKQIDAAKIAGAPVIELHTGHYADADTRSKIDSEFEKIRIAVGYADAQGLIVNAGHGLNYSNVERICLLSEINELNIGHAIVARAIITGIASAVLEMKQLMRNARWHAVRPSGDD